MENVNKTIFSKEIKQKPTLKVGFLVSYIIIYKNKNDEYNWYRS